MSEPVRDEHTGVDTTGHEWDGIRELDNPLPEQMPETPMPVRRSSSNNSSGRTS